MHGSRADAYVRPQQGPSLEASIKPLHEGPGGNSVALQHSPSEYEAFRFLK